MSEETNKTGGQGSKPKRKRKPGEYRYQFADGAASWMDSEGSYKGPVEALEAASKEVPVDAIVRAVRIASREFKVEADTKRVLKPRTSAK